VSEAEQWLLHLLPASGGLALDIGANEGSFTVMLADRFAEVHAFEPNLQIIPRLRSNVAARANVRLFELAAYHRPAVLTLHLYELPEHATAYPSQREAWTSPKVDGPIRVPATALDLLGYPAGLKVDFAKIDVEAGEADVLAGLDETISEWLPQLLVEIHSLDNLEWCRDFLGNRGYDVEHIPHPHPGVYPGHCWLSAFADARSPRKEAPVHA
jgi:FkbM family methyltransferase